MIRSFADRETERLHRRYRVPRWSPELQKLARRKLLVLEAAISLDDLKAAPGNRLEKLGGVRRGQWSIRVNDQWRVCFRWADDGLRDVQLVDYH